MKMGKHVWLGELTCSRLCLGVCVGSQGMESHQENLSHGPWSRILGPWSPVILSHVFSSLVDLEMVDVVILAKRCLAQRSFVIEVNPI